LLLDEIGDMSVNLQAKLLRVLAEGVIVPLGAEHAQAVNVHLLAATHRDLGQQVAEGRFREDLFYRLNVVEMNIPPLRERPEDILALAQKFIDELTQGRARLSSAVGELLQHYSWPGNVRELRNAMERAALLSRGEMILPEHLPMRVRSSSEPPPAPVIDEQKLDDIERTAMLQTLKKHDYNRTETAKALGISRRALIYKLQRLRELGYQIDSPS